MCLRGTVRSDRRSYVTRVQLTDSDWEFIEPCLPIGEYGTYPERLRQQFEGVIRRFKTGGQWREMPTEFGAWSTVHDRFRHPEEGTGTRARRPTPHPGRTRGRGQGVLVPRRPRPPAQTPYQGGHPGEEGPGRQPEEVFQRWPTRQSRRRSPQGAEHRRTPDQQAQDMARHLHPIRQDSRQLPRRSPPARLDDLDQGPHQDHPRQQDSDALRCRTPRAGRSSVNAQPVVDAGLHPWIPRRCRRCRPSRGEASGPATSAATSWPGRGVSWSPVPAPCVRPWRR